MGQVIRDERLVDDDFTRLTDDEARVDGDIIVSLARWRRERDELMRHPGRVSVVVQSDDSVDELAQDFHHFAFIALEFASFTDGRGYSQARRLREQYHYRGELRAVGEVLVDQLYLMRRCGIDAYQLRDDQDPQAALAALNALSVHYQSAADGSGRPAWRRR
ncbi:MAG: DUF934 domain-containing protein [Candidatus Competibacterales bacterium]